MLNFVEISHRIENPSMIKLEDLEELRQLAKRYPFTAIFSQLYLKGLALHNTIQFESELKNHAYKIPDRAQLFYLVHSVEENIHHANSPMETISESNISDDSTEGVLIEEKESIGNSDIEVNYEASQLDVIESSEEQSKDGFAPELANEEVDIDESTFGEAQKVSDEATLKSDIEITVLPGEELLVEETAVIEEANDDVVKEDTLSNDSFLEVNQDDAAELEEDEPESNNESIVERSDVNPESISTVSESTNDAENTKDEENSLSPESESESETNERKKRIEISNKLRNVSDLDRDILAHAVSSSIFIEVNESEADTYSFERLKKLDRSEVSDEEDYDDEFDSSSITFDLPLNDEEVESEIEEKADFESKTKLDSGEDKKSFTSWMSSFISEENTRTSAEKLVDSSQKEVKSTRKSEEKEKNKEILAPEKRKSEFFSPIKKARESLDESRLPVSETLAKVYSAQGNYPKAIEAYEKLLLKFPEKKSFFALQIETLKRKLN